MKNAYEIRLDILVDAHKYCMNRYMAQLESLGEAPTADQIKTLYPTVQEVVGVAEQFYGFVSDNHK